MFTLFQIRPGIFFARLKYHSEEADGRTLMDDNPQVVARTRIQ